MKFDKIIKKVTKLLEKIPDILEKNHDDKLLEEIQDIEGFSEKTAKKILNNLSKAKIFIKNISNHVVFKEDKKISNCLNNKKYVLLEL